MMMEMRKWSEYADFADVDARAKREKRLHAAEEMQQAHSEARQRSIGVDGWEGWDGGCNEFKGGKKVHTEQRSCQVRVRSQLDTDC